MSDDVAQAGAFGMPPLPLPQSATPPQQAAASTPPQRTRMVLWQVYIQLSLWGRCKHCRFTVALRFGSTQGTMMLGGKLCKGTMQKLWQCKACINTSSTALQAALGRNWPSELVRCQGQADNIGNAMNAVALFGMFHALPKVLQHIKIVQHLKL